MPTTSKENYLKALFHLQDEHSQVSLTKLSESLGISKASANNMVKKLEKKDWVSYKRYHPITITAEGKKQAALVIRKHRLAEMFLTQIMGFGWEEVHDIAEELEHVNADTLFDRMDEMLGHPSLDPHGSPIPTKDGRLPQQSRQNLAAVPVGETVSLAALRNTEKDFLVFLTKKNIQLGDRITVVDKEDFDQTLTVLISDQQLQLSQQVCQSLLVE